MYFISISLMEQNYSLLTNNFIYQKPDQTKKYLSKKLIFFFSIFLPGRQNVDNFFQSFHKKGNKIIASTMTRILSPERSKTIWVSAPLSKPNPKADLEMRISNIN